MSEHRHDPEPHWARALHDKLDHAHHLLERIIQMSGSLGDQLNSGLTSVSNVLDAIQSDVSTVASEVAALVAGLTPGATVTQAMVDQANALATKAQAIDDALKAVAAQGAPTVGGTPSG